jgi:hypothetical protein
MLIRFQQDYLNSFDAAYSKIAKLEAKIANKEEFVGSSKQLDKMRAHSLLISALTDHLQNEDNESPIGNETFLQCLNKLITTNIC